MNIRKLGINDINVIINLRIDYLLSERGPMTREEQDDVKQKMKAYINKWMPDGSFVVFIAEDNDNICSTAFLSVVERPPRVAFQSYLVGTVYNVFTFPNYRRKGIATKVLSALLDEARIMGIGHIDLMSTNDGKYLYEKIGFQMNNYTPMRLTLKQYD